LNSGRNTRPASLTRRCSNERRSDRLVDRFADAGITGNREDAVLSWFAAEEVAGGEGERIHVPCGVCAGGEVCYNIFALGVCTIAVRNLLEGTMD
jgi:hypothetical protein